MFALNHSSANGNRLRLGRVAMAIAAGGLLAAIAMPGGAQELDGAALWSLGGCFNCHGALAAGDGDPAYPVGPSLRSSRLSRDQFLETLACGRPSTGMPFNLAGAYTQTPCYGLPLGAPPAVLAGADFTPAQIEALVDFLMNSVVGVRTITRENCAVFFDGNVNAPTCRQY